MLPVSPEFMDALASSQLVSARADLIKGGVTVLSGLPATAGTVTASRTQAASRRLDCTLAPEIPLADYLSEPVFTGDMVGVYGHEVQMWWTLHFPSGGQESAPLGRFRIDTLSGSLADDQPVTLSGSSREAYLVDETLIVPRTLSGPSAQSLIVQLIVEAMSGAQVVVSATRDARVPTTPFSGTRWAAIKLLADTIAATVRCDAYGRFMVADAPTVDTAPAWKVTSGPGGVLVSAGGQLDRSGIRNAWVVQGGSPSSDMAPIQGVVYDDNPTSPTFYGDPDAGAFGRCAGLKQVPTLTTVTQCKDVGRALLAQSCGAASSLDLSTVPNPALELADVVDVIPDVSNPAGTVRRHMVDGFTFDIVPGGPFSAQTRDLRQVDDD